MKKILLATFLLSAAVTAHAEQFSLSSPEIKPGATIKNEQVFSGFGCTGGNVSPTLEWIRHAKFVERQKNVRTAVPIHIHFFRGAVIKQVQSGFGLRVKIRPN